MLESRKTCLGFGPFSFLDWPINSKMTMSTSRKSLDLHSSHGQPAIENPMTTSNTTKMMKKTTRDARIIRSFTAQIADRALLN